MSGLRFNGFPKECIEFYKELVEHNDRAWFDEHREEYNEFVLDPARAFVVQMGEALRELSPKIVADPRINKSIFRIYRDVRFSRDKSPYKTHLGILFWVSGYGAKLGSPGFYLHIEADHIMVAAGVYEFSKPILAHYRNAAVHPRQGKRLREIVSTLTKDGSRRLGGQHYKRVPKGYDPAHPSAELLLHKGLFTTEKSPLPRELHTPGFIDYCFEKFSDMHPLVNWLEAMIIKSV